MACASLIPRRSKKMRSMSGPIGFMRGDSWCGGAKPDGGCRTSGESERRISVDRVKVHSSAGGRRDPSEGFDIRYFREWREAMELQASGSNEEATSWPVAAFPMKRTRL